MGPHLLQQLHRQDDAVNLWEHGINTTPRTKCCDTVVQAPCAYLITVRPQLDLAWGEDLAAIEAARPLGLFEYAAILEAKAMQMLLIA